MLIYEVKIKTQPQTFQPFLKWLNEKHVLDVIKAGSFLKGEVFTLPEQCQICVQYWAPNQVILDKYLAEKAPTLRQEAVNLFSETFTAERAIWRHEMSCP